MNKKSLQNSKYVLLSDVDFFWKALVLKVHMSNLPQSLIDGVAQKRYNRTFFKVLMLLHSHPKTRGVEPSLSYFLLHFRASTVKPATPAPHNNVPHSFGTPNAGHKSVVFHLHAYYDRIKH